MRNELMARLLFLFLTLMLTACGFETPMQKEAKVGKLLIEKEKLDFEIELQSARLDDLQRSVSGGKGFLSAEGFRVFSERKTALENRLVELKVQKVGVEKEIELLQRDIRR